MTESPVLIQGQWRKSKSSGTFQAENPATMQPLDGTYPISGWEDCDEALDAAAEAAHALQQMPSERIAIFLETYANQIEASRDKLVELAHAETALPKTPRLADVELPRTTTQLRLAAAAARDNSWVQATIDSQANIRSMYGPLGPVCVFGPNNFPFAFGSISGGDFAAALGAGNPVIAKANSSHPGTTRLFAEAAQRAAEETDMPPGTVQLIYRTPHDVGAQLVSDPRVGATGYTGSRSAGLKLKTAADAAGKPIYLELSSVNPVILLPGVLRERLEDLASEFTSSCLMGAGQFCTNPGMIILIQSAESEAFIKSVSEKFASAPIGTLLSKSVSISLETNLKILQDAGAQCLTGNASGGGAGYSHANALLSISGKEFLGNPATMQTEAFGNSSLFVIAENIREACDILTYLEGNLTGCIYSAANGEDDPEYDRLAPLLRSKVGRLLNDKMPTGVAVSSAMNHGGPFPATGHAGFTAVGIPAAMNRFAALQCYDNIRPHRLPDLLADKNPTGQMWRLIDGTWSTADVSIS